MGKPYSEVAIGDFAARRRRGDLVRSRPNGRLDGVLLELDRHLDRIGMLLVSLWMWDEMSVKRSS